MWTTLLPILEQAIILYERTFGLRISREAMNGIPASDAFANKQALYEFVNTTSFFRAAPVMPGIIKAVAFFRKLTGLDLTDLYSVFFSNYLIYKSS